MEVIDSSALVRFFSKEEGWERVSPYVEESMTLSLAVVELGNALLKKVRIGEIKLKSAMEMLAMYSKKAFLLNDEEYAELAFGTALDNGIAMYDSMFIAACKDEGLGLVTCDGNQAEAARRLGITVTEC